MPQLQELWLEDCKLLEEVPSGVEFLACLNELHIINMGDQLLSKLDPSSQDSDFLRVEHVPMVYIGIRNPSECIAGVGDLQQFSSFSLFDARASKRLFQVSGLYVFNL
ncbi:hypothetical protein L484_001496 [Morus notabilis]|uniref:Disease resistance protein n=1 Tax=Morus notabilis TaxID=981085 RepID=W9QH87_9ROSA|nr:hypothetical protein L484_001496 [Morus notabilis]